MFPVADYIVFLVFTSVLSFIQERVLEGKLWPIELVHRTLFLNLSFEPYRTELSRGYPQRSQSKVRILPRIRPWDIHSVLFFPFRYPLIDLNCDASGFKQFKPC
jgi:hypothetical protein